MQERVQNLGKKPSTKSSQQLEVDYWSKDGMRFIIISASGYPPIVVMDRRFLNSKPVALNHNHRADFVPRGRGTVTVDTVGGHKWAGPIGI